MRKEELKQIILDPLWIARREKQKARNIKNSRAAQKWKAREKCLLEKAKSMILENRSKLEKGENIKRQNHYIEEKIQKSEKNQQKTD